MIKPTIETKQAVEQSILEACISFFAIQVFTEDYIQPIHCAPTHLAKHWVLLDAITATGTSSTLLGVSCEEHVT